MIINIIKLLKVAENKLKPKIITLVTAYGIAHSASSYTRSHMLSRIAGVSLTLFNHQYCSCCETLTQRPSANLTAVSN